MDDAKTIFENRANGLGVSEVVFQVAGNRRIVGEFPGLTNTEEVISVLRQVGQLAFVEMGDTPLAEGTVVNVDYSGVTGTTATQTTPEALAQPPRRRQAPPLPRPIPLQPRKCPPFWLSPPVPIFRKWVSPRIPWVSIRSASL